MTHLASTIFFLLYFLFSVHAAELNLTRIPVDIFQGPCPTHEQFQRVRNKSRSLLNEITSTLSPHPCGGRGWRRIAFINMSDPNQNCPSGLVLVTSPFRLCGRTPLRSPSCSSTNFSVGLSPYSRVCGRIKGYHQNLKFAFYRLGNDLESYYVDGVSLTHGSPGNRQHIWSFAIGLNNVYRVGERINYYCPGDGQVALPSFITNDYFCDSGAYPGSSQTDGVYVDNPLWDGVGCVGDIYTPPRCFINNPPWFHKVLPSATTDDIELRVCGYELIGNVNYGDTLLQEIEIYVQ